jgi:hypothetical protein
VVHAAVCLERRIIVHDATVNEVIDACHTVFKEMGLKVTEEKSSHDGRTVVLAKEGALVPLVLKTLLFPLSISQYLKSAQRSGVHVVVSPTNEGVHVYSCGIALDETTGDLAKYSKEELMEEVSGTMESLNFENEFITRMLEIFPKAKEVK